MADMKRMLTAAYSNKFAIPAINFESYEILKGVILGACYSRAPIIVQTTEAALKEMEVNDIVYMVNAYEKMYDVPVSLHLDHATCMDIIVECIEAGYKSVMIDASKTSFEENVKITNEVTRFAHKKNVLVEGELGVIGNDKSNVQKTELVNALEYVKMTNVDSLAISIGNLHGGREKTIRIDFELLDELSRVIDVPLVLHGSSGIVNKDLARVREYGICKINIETELRILYRKSLEIFLREYPEEIRIRKMNEYINKKIIDWISKKCELYGCQGKKIE